MGKQIAAMEEKGEKLKRIDLLLDAFVRVTALARFNPEIQGNCL
jgi:hypothetical protein